MLTMFIILNLIISMTFSFSSNDIQCVAGNLSHC